MRIRMLKNQKRAPDGIHAVEHKVGEVVDLPDPVSLSWIAQGIAEEDKMKQGTKETKVKKNAYKKDHRASKRATKPGRSKKTSPGRPKRK